MLDGSSSDVVVVLLFAEGKEGKEESAATLVPTSADPGNHACHKRKEQVKVAESRQSRLKRFACESDSIA